MFLPTEITIRALDFDALALTALVLPHVATLPRVACPLPLGTVTIFFMAIIFPSVGLIICENNKTYILQHGLELLS